MAENDGIDDELRAALQVALTTAARVAEQVARAREAGARDAQARSVQAGREDAGRLTAERDAARASLAPVHRSEWWDGAQTDDVVKAYETARSWSDMDPEAMRAEQRIVSEIKDRFGVEAVSGDPDSLRSSIARADSERGKGQGDEQETSALMLAADQADRRAQEAAERSDRESEAGSPDAADDDAESVREAATAEELEVAGGLAYDSAERRAEMAHRLEGKVDNKTAVEARVRADTSQGAPATGATRRTSSKAPKARRSRATTGGRQSQRGEQAR